MSNQPRPYEDWSYKAIIKDALNRLKEEQTRAYLENERLLGQIERFEKLLERELDS